VPLGAAFIAMAGLQIFKYYAWINETAYISFAAWVLVVGIIGVKRWGEMDDRALGVAPVVPARVVRAPEPEPDDEEEEPAPAPRPRKPAARKTTTRKSTPRKAPARKA
jgi:hypothetical protein